MLVPTLPWLRSAFLQSLPLHPLLLLLLLLLLLRCYSCSAMVGSGLDQPHQSSHLQAANDNLHGHHSRQRRRRRQGQHVNRQGMEQATTVRHGFNTHVIHAQSMQGVTGMVFSHGVTAATTQTLAAGATCKQHILLNHRFETTEPH